MLVSEEILEESVDVHCTHPTFQSNTVLLHFLDRLAFRYIRRFDAKIQRELTPCLNLFGIEFLNKFKQAVDFEVFIVALRW